MSSLVDKVPGRADLTFHLNFERDQESGWYTVHVAELPGCISQGATIEEAKRNVAAALQAYMEVLLEDTIRNQAKTGTPSNNGDIAELLVRPHFEIRA